MSTRRSNRDSAQAPLHPLPTYWERTQWPLQSLVFLLPLLILYEIGSVFYASGGSSRLPSILAESLLGQFFEWFGVTGVYLPPLLVVVVLIAWHMTRRDPWTLEPRLYGGMFIESLMLALPLLVLNIIISREAVVVPTPSELSPAIALASGIDGYPWQAQMVLSIGAGIYEELLFRLIAIAMLHFIHPNARLSG